MRVGRGSNTTATTMGTLPFLFLIRFRASVRVFCDLSLRIVHLQETLACKMLFGFTLARNGVNRPNWSASDTNCSEVLILASSTGWREIVMSVRAKHSPLYRAHNSGFSLSRACNVAIWPYCARAVAHTQIPVVFLVRVAGKKTCKMCANNRKGPIAIHMHSAL